VAYTLYIVNRYCSVIYASKHVFWARGEWKLHIHSPMHFVPSLSNRWNTLRPFTSWVWLILIWWEWRAIICSKLASHGEETNRVGAWSRRSGEGYVSPASLCAWAMWIPFPCCVRTTRSSRTTATMLMAAVVASPSYTMQCEEENNIECVGSSNVFCIRGNCVSSPSWSPISILLLIF
jgi:hypothetical protein